MLTEFLRSFTLPGLEKKYIVADESLTEEGAAADSKKVGQELAKKVDKETGKALSTNDYTNAEKTKLAGVDSGAQVNTIEGVKVDGTEVTPDAQKKVNLNVYDKAAIDAIVQAIYADVAKKLNIDGYSELATVGNALGLVTDSVVEDKEPYNFRSLAHLPVGKFCYDTIVGGSVVWNQLARCNRPTETVLGVDITNNGDGSITLNGTATGRGSRNVDVQLSSVPIGHAFFVSGYKKVGTNKGYLGFAGYVNDSGSGGIWKNTTTYDSLALRIDLYEGDTFNNVKMYPMYIDLTAAVTPTIADYIYSLEQTTAGAGVAWFKKYFPGIYYGYAEPHFEHVQTSAKVTVGFNQWDEEWELGILDLNTGANEPATNRIRSKNYVPCFPNTGYYTKDPTNNQNFRFCYYTEDKTFISSTGWKGNDTFTTPANAYYFRFYVGGGYGATYNNDVCINIHGDRDGEYEPYRKRTYPIEPKVLRGVLKLDSANRLYFDGDIYRHDGSGEQRFDLVDMGTLNWAYDATNTRFYVSFPDARYPNYTTLLSPMYAVSYNPIGSHNVDLQIATYGGRIYLTNFAYTDAASFKAAMSGVYLLYEKATPEPFTAEPFQSPMVVDPLGTEEFVDYAVEQGDRDVKIPCGHTSEYPEDLVDKLEVLPHATGTNGDYLITEINGKLYLKPYTQTVGLTSVSETEAE